MIDEAKNANQTLRMENHFKLINENTNLANEKIKNLTLTLKQQVEKTTQAVN
jgi:hypothetical protein